MQSICNTHLKGSEMLWNYTDEIGTENRNICVGIRNINQFKIFILN